MLKENINKADGYSKGCVVYCPIPKYSPCNLVIVLDLIPMNFNCLVFRAFSRRLIPFWVYQFQNAFDVIFTVTP